MLCTFRPTAPSIRSTLYAIWRFRTSTLATFSCPTWTCGRPFPSTTFSKVSLPTFSTTTCSPASFPPLRLRSLLALRSPTAFQSLFFPKRTLNFRSVPRFPRSKPELIQCLKNQSCFLYREKKSTHVDPLLAFDAELSLREMVSFGLPVSLLAGSVLVQLDSGALRDGQAIERASQVRRAFRELRLQQNHLAAPPDSARLLLRSHLTRLRDGFAASRVLLWRSVERRSKLRQQYVDEWNSEGGSSMLRMYRQFMKELEEEPDRTVVPICSPRD